MFKYLACLVVLSVTAACSGGSHETNGGSGAFDLVSGELGGLFRRGTAEETDPRNLLNAELIAGSPTSLLLVVRRKLDSAFTMVPLSVNLGVEQWRDAGGGGLLRRNGILVGTRGLGYDLLTADVGPLTQALSRGGGEAVRVNRYLDGENQVVATQYLCTVTNAGRQTLVFYGSRYETSIFEEACSGSQDSFVNRYWIDASGGIRRSEERVTPQVGVLEISTLKR